MQNSPKCWLKWIFVYAIPTTLSVYWWLSRLLPLTLVSVGYSLGEIHSVEQVTLFSKILTNCTVCLISLSVVLLAINSLFSPIMRKSYINKVRRYTLRTIFALIVFFIIGDLLFSLCFNPRAVALRVELIPWLIVYLMLFLTSIKREKYPFMPIITAILMAAIVVFQEIRLLLAKDVIFWMTCVWIAFALLYGLAYYFITYHGFIWDWETMVLKEKTY